MLRNPLQRPGKPSKIRASVLYILYIYTLLYLSILMILVY